MSSTVRSHLAVAVAAVLLAAFVATGLQAAFAGDEGFDPKVVADGDFYFRTKSTSCPIGGGNCVFTQVRVSCYEGDDVIGGTGWVVSPTDRVTNMAAIGLADLPAGARAWRVVSPEDVLEEGWMARVRVYCANTG